MRLDTRKLYELTDDLIATYKPVVQTLIDELKYELRKPVSAKIDSIYCNFTNTEMNPYRVSVLLQDSFGYRDIGMERDGWENEYWWQFYKEGEPTLCLCGTSIIGTVILRYEHNNWDRID